MMSHEFTAAASSSDAAQGRTSDFRAVAPLTDSHGRHAGSHLPRLSSSARLRLTASLARQLHVLVATGIPLSQSLHAAHRQTTHAGWKSVLLHLSNAVDEGTPLSVAMAESANFSPVAISLIHAGETSGDMPAMLQRLSDLTSKQLKLRSAVTGAMVYPAMLVTMGVGVLITMLTLVLPRFKILFSSLDTPLPTTTQALMNVSDLLVGRWYLLAPSIPVMLTGLVFAMRSPRCRLLIDRYYLSLPIVGPLGKSVLSARIARMLGTLLESRVQLTEALELTRHVAGNQSYCQLVQSIEDAVSRGHTLTSVTDHTPLLVPSVQEAIRSGEQSGRLSQPLVHLAEFLDEENDNHLKQLTRILEPLILIFLGVVVGFVAISIFLPMFDIITAAQGGGAPPPSSPPGGAP